MGLNNKIAFFIGIDDTDNPDSRGTGFHARELAHILEKKADAEVIGISRHQLFVNPNIRYTSQNSSACIHLITDNIGMVTSICEEYLKTESAEGSDAGLCIVPSVDVNQEIKSWGLKAKDTVLNMDEAYKLATSSNVYLQGFTGNHEGIIGSLAAVGLRAGGNDGRYIWRKGKKELREVEAGIFLIKDLIKELELDAIQTLEGTKPDMRDTIIVNDWVRPLLKNHQAVLIAEKNENDHEHEWKLTTKEIIRRIS